MNSESLLKFFVFLSGRQYRMGVGYVKANFKYVKAYEKNIKTFALVRQSVFFRVLGTFIYFFYF